MMLISATGGKLQLYWPIISGRTAEDVPRSTAVLLRLRNPL